MKVVQLDIKKKRYAFLTYSALLIVTVWLHNFYLIVVMAVVMLGAYNALVHGEYWHWEQKE